MYEFKQSVKIDDKTFRLGRHHVPEEILQHPDFLSFVNCGWIAEVDPAKAPVVVETFAERCQRLANKLAKHVVPPFTPEPVKEHKGRKGKAEKGE